MAAADATLRAFVAVSRTALCAISNALDRSELGGLSEHPRTRHGIADTVGTPRARSRIGTLIACKKGELVEDGWRSTGTNMSYIARNAWKLWRAEEAVSIPEYALLISFLTLGTIAIATTLTDAIRNFFTDAGNELGAMTK